MRATHFRFAAETGYVAARHYRNASRGGLAMPPNLLALADELIE
jgi:hypothetical protein